jgi:hypothetical protein
MKKFALILTLFFATVFSQSSYKFAELKTNLSVEPGLVVVHGTAVEHGFSISQGISVDQSFQFKYLNLMDQTGNKEQKISESLIPMATKKNAGLAILSSMLLPGMRELYAEGYESGKYFTIAEGALWLTFGGMKYYSMRQKDNYFSYAESYGGVKDMAGKDADYYANIGNYLNINDFNDDMAKQGQFSKMYNTNTHFWDWGTNNSRKSYREMWSSSENWNNNLRFVIGGMILNRLASAINAVRLTARYNKGVETSWNFWFDYNASETAYQNISLNFIKSF